jgi:mRNA interferase MazF
MNDRAWYAQGRDGISWGLTSARPSPGRRAGAPPLAMTTGSTRVRRGDLFWVEPDESRGSIAHPHVVVQDDIFNRSRLSTVIVCALTSNLARATEPGNVLLDAGEGGLAKQSVVVVSQVSSIEKARLGAYIGALSDERVDQILNGLRFQQTSFFFDR